MKKKHNLRLMLFTLALTLLSCSAQNNIKGTASDRTGTNGATNGTGKIARGI